MFFFSVIGAIQMRYTHNISEQLWSSDVYVWIEYVVAV